MFGLVGFGIKLYSYTQLKKEENEKTIFKKSTTKLLFINKCILVALLFLFGCSTKNIEKANTETTCLVLSVGAERNCSYWCNRSTRDLGYEFDYVYVLVLAL